MVVYWHLAPHLARAPVPHLLDNPYLRPGRVFALGFGNHECVFGRRLYSQMLDVKDWFLSQIPDDSPILALLRSEERRVGKECRSWWLVYHQRKKKKKQMT